ncbi:MAG: hypothetical protein HY897_10220 [Deltaproteobacteria bacterium]|nr:hypothetical protein [Deltaproteobacteria bacterium]
MRYLPAAFIVVSLAVVFAMSPGCGGSDSDTSDAGGTEPDAGTADTGPGGGTVTLEDGTHQGPMTVAAGGTLKAANPGGATVENDKGAVIIVETAPGKTTTVSGLKVKSAGGAAILVKGSGDFTGDNLDVACTKGLGIAAEGAANFALSSTSISGNITPDQIPNLYFPLKGTEYPIIGTIVSKTTKVTLTDVTVTGFGGFGAVFVASNGSWDRGAVTGNVGVGIMQSGGTLNVSDVKIDGTQAGERGMAIFSYGMVAANKAALSTDHVEIADNKGFGILQEDSSSSHDGLKLNRNTEVGLWVQKSPGTVSAPSLVVKGEGSELNENKGGGIFAIESGGIDISAASLSRAVVKKITAGETGLVEMADGLQVSNLTGDLKVNNASFADNTRIGVLLSGTPAPGANVTFDGVTISGASQYGLLGVEGFTVGAGWGVTKDPSLAEVDTNFTGTLGVASATSKVPSLGKVESSGLIGGSGIVSESGDVTQAASVGEHGLGE